MDVLLKLTPNEIERYAPYHLWTEFGDGFTDYELGHRAREPQGDSLQAQVGQQAYDRGAELAMRRSMQTARVRQALRERGR